MDAELQLKLAEQEKKLEMVWISVEKTRKYFFWTMVIQIALFVLPIVGIVLAIPFFMSTFGSLYNGLL